MPQIFTAVAIGNELYENTTDVRPGTEKDVCGQSARKRRQAPCRVIFYRREIQAVGRERGRRAVAIARVEHLAQPRAAATAFADLHQASHDVSHHVMQKRIGGELEQDELTETGNSSAAQILHRRERLTLGGAKRAEVMHTEQCLRCILHAFHIERSVVPART
jgi:hypothetical protein